MKVTTDEADVLRRTVVWTTDLEQVRAVLLTSSRVRPGAPLDALSDYDVILIVEDASAFAANEAWALGFGEPLLTVRDNGSVLHSTTYNCMVLYTDGTKIDYGIWPLEVVERIKEQETMPGDLDEAHRVLVDKDLRMVDLPAPTGRVYLPAPPTAQEFRSLVEEWWFCATYVAKYLWRGAFMPVKLILDHEMKHLILGRLFAWRIGIDNNWSVNPGFFSRNLHTYIDHELWAAFEATYVGPLPADNWDALERLNMVFRAVASSVAADLGFEYPEAMDQQMTTYLMQIKHMPTDRV